MATKYFPWKVGIIASSTALAIAGTGWFATQSSAGSSSEASAVSSAGSIAPSVVDSQGVTAAPAQSRQLAPAPTPRAKKSRGS